MPLASVLPRLVLVVCMGTGSAVLHSMSLSPTETSESALLRVKALCLRETVYQRLFQFLYLLVTSQELVASVTEPSHVSRASFLFVSVVVLPVP